MKRRHAKKARGDNGELRMANRSGSISSTSDAGEGDDPGQNGSSKPHGQPTPISESLESVGIIELLDADSRPTFILDLCSPVKEIEGRIKVVWSNKALNFFDELRRIVYTQTYFPTTVPPSPLDSFAAAEHDFKEWAICFLDFDGKLDGYLPRHTFKGMFWTSTTLRNRWRVISASQVLNQRTQSHGTPRSGRSNSRSSSRSRRASTDDRSSTDTGISEESELEMMLADSESKFKVLTELNPVGMYYLSPEGNILYCNDEWYNITGHPRGLESEMSFMNVLSEIDHPMMGREWDLLTKSKGTRTFELRLRKPWIDEKTGEAKQKWILASCGQDFDESGNLKTIMGCITDISIQKFAENIQLESRLQAEEAKKQQESFIDMTSHEMRNPLGAIMLCADGIATSMKEFKLKLKLSEDRSELISQTEELLESNLDAAQTILLCAQHQKRIIDDVLTLSKINSTMVHVTPVQVDIESTVRRTLKMFDSELQADAIKMNFVVEKSLTKIYCDPVRLTQIFINLLTNAIKFTRSETLREITINISASIAKPTKAAAPGIQWFPSKDAGAMRDLTEDSEWGNGERLYLYFSVKDTGRGLCDMEKTKLFTRFSQANPRTHVQYGGSGLGLFISRELTELQGGQIGLQSVKGVGSTFAFYIKARRALSSDNLPSPSSMEELPSPRKRRADTPMIPVALPPAALPLPAKVQVSYDILLVEDNLINQKVLSKQLRGLGCTVHVANHGVEALDFLTKTTLWNDPSLEGPQFDLSVILMDLEMPIMDGLAATRRIRELEKEGKLKGHLPIIAVTANTRGEQMDVARQAGMDDIVAKPFQLPDLISKMELLVGGGAGAGL